VGAGRDAHRPALRAPTRPTRLLSGLRRVRAGGSHRSRWHARLTGTSRGRGTTSVASDQQRERSGHNTRRTAALLDPAAFIASRSRRRHHPLVVRSFATQITVLDGAIITILRVRRLCLSHPQTRPSQPVNPTHAVATPKTLSYQPTDQPGRYQSDRKPRFWPTAQPPFACFRF
jgi:hypothetical protein